MPFSQDQIDRLIVNRAKILRYAFIPQLLVALIFLGFSYKTGKVHAYLLFRGVRTQGKIVGMRPVRFSGRSGSGSSSFASTIYEPTVEFRAGDHLVRFQEWKGSESNSGLGWSVPVLYDPNDVSLAMMDRAYWNWLPWGPCFAVGSILALASIKGLFAFLFQRSPVPDMSPSS